MLIADEVQTGLGLTGKMWAWQHLGPAPDLVAFGKKTQTGGFMSTGTLYNLPLLLLPPTSLRDNHIRRSNR